MARPPRGGGWEAAPHRFRRRVNAGRTVLRETIILDPSVAADASLTCHSAVRTALPTVEGHTEVVGHGCQSGSYERRDAQRAHALGHGAVEAWADRESSGQRSRSWPRADSRPRRSSSRCCAAAVHGSRSQDGRARRTLRVERAARTLERAADVLNVGLAELERLAARDDARTELLARVLAASAHTATAAAKVEALGQVLADGLQDDARLDEALLLAAALHDLEALHVRVLVAVGHVGGEEERRLRGSDGSVDLEQSRRERVHPSGTCCYSWR